MNSINLINQPLHFFYALSVVASFLIAVFHRNEKVKIVTHRVLYYAFALAFVSGATLVFTLPFSSFVLIKAVFGVGVIVMAEMILRNKGSKLMWTLMLSTSTVGGGIAYFLI